MQCTLAHHTSDQYTWKINLDLEKNDFFYKDYFTVFSDHPAVKIISWKLNEKASEYYDPVFKKVKNIIQKPIEITVQTKMHPATEQAYLHVAYYRKSDTNLQYELIPLALVTEQKEIIIPSKTVVPEKTAAAPEPICAPSPFGMWLSVVVCMGFGRYYAKRMCVMQAICCIALSVLLSFQAIKFTVRYRKHLPKFGITLLSERKKHL